MILCRRRRAAANGLPQTGRRKRLWNWRQINEDWISCGLCGILFPDEAVLKNHKHKAHPGKFLSKCSQSYETETLWPRNQGILKGEVSLYSWPPVWLVWNQPYDNWQFLFLFAKQTNPNQSNRRSMVQWYSPPYWRGRISMVDLLVLNSWEQRLILKHMGFFSFLQLLC